MITSAWEVTGSQYIFNGKMDKIVAYLLCLQKLVPCKSGETPDPLPPGPFQVFCQT